MEHLITPCLHAQITDKRLKGAKPQYLHGYQIAKRLNVILNTQVLAHVPKARVK